MEPRARAAKNLGKSNFESRELAQFLIAHGDTRPPLPETIRVLDEMLTDFIQGVSFEAARAATLAGRQKCKFEDFQFAMRKNPKYLGKVEENKAKGSIIAEQKRLFNETGGDGAEEALLAAGEGLDGEPKGGKGRGRGGKRRKLTATEPAAEDTAQRRQSNGQNGDAGPSAEIMDDLGFGEDDDIDADAELDLDDRA